MHSVPLQVSLLLGLAGALAAQGTKDPVAEIASLEKAAKDDVAALLEVAETARARQLLTEWRRLMQRVLTLAPDHEAANLAVGNVKHDGRWMSPAKAEILAKRAAGMVNVGGVWVREAEADDARAGIFRFQGDVVTRSEYLALSAGQVRHPRTGELIDGKDLEKAKNNLFPDGKGGWWDEAQANKRHSDTTSPWVVRTKSVTLLSTMPLKELEQQVVPYVDDAHDLAAQVFGGRPHARPYVLVTPTTDQFRELGTRIGGASSAYGAFLAERTIDVPGLGSVLPAVALLDPNWGAYYVKHAVGVAVAHAYAGGALPAWLAVGTGAYAERFYNPEISNWFGKQFLGAGGLLDLGKWFSGFRVDGEMEHAEMGQQIFQAGLMVAFCRHGGDAEAGKLLAAVGDALAGGDAKATRAAVAALQTGLRGRADAIRAYLKHLTQG